MKRLCCIVALVCGAAFGEEPTSCIVDPGSETYETPSAVSTEATFNLASQTFATAVSAGDVVTWYTYTFAVLSGIAVDTSAPGTLLLLR